MTTELAEIKPRSSSLIERFGDRYGLAPARVLGTLKATCFRTDKDKPITDEQMTALMIVAEQYSLNPFTKELYAFPDSKSGGIVPVVSVDGWARIINEHPMLDGIELEVSPDGAACRCTIHRKDRSRPTVVVELLKECKRNTAPWQSHPNRMLRHKALIQCARLAFGFAGIYDHDEARRILAANNPQARELPTNAQAQRVTAILTGTNPSAEAGAPLKVPTVDMDKVRSSIADAIDAEEASEALDYARSFVTAEQFEELTSIWRAKWDDNVSFDNQPEQPQ